MIRENLRLKFVVFLWVLWTCLYFAGASWAEGTLWSEIDRTSVNNGVFYPTSSNTPTIWKSGQNPCLIPVTDRSTGFVYQNVPTPAYFSPDQSPAPADHQAAIIDQTGRAPHSYYELHTLRPDGWTANGCHKWSAGFVTTEDSGGGIQGSGIPYIGGSAAGGSIVRFNDLQSGSINHVVQIEVPISCAYFKAPAIRRDAVSTTNDPNCIPEGQRWRLPAPTNCALPFWLESRLCEAMRGYGLVATDQTHDKAMIRLEGVKKAGASYQGDPPGNPYWDVGGWFQCHFSGDSNCQPEWASRHIPWWTLEKEN